MAVAGFRILVFVLCFIVEVRIDADEPKPLNIDEGQFYTGTSRLVWQELEKTKLLLFSDSVVFRSRESTASLLRGKILLDVMENATLETKLGQIDLMPGKYQISSHNHLIQIRTLIGKASIRPLGEENSLDIGEAHSVDLYPVDQSGKSRALLPAPMPWREYTRTLAFFYAHDRSELKGLLKKKLESWSNAVELSSKINREIASYTIAMEESRAIRARQIQRERRKQKKESREWLWNKAFEE